MFRKCGRKIQITSIIWFSVLSLASVIGAIVLWSYNNRYFSTVGWGFLVLIGGNLLAIINAWFMYGFGVIVEKAEHDREEFVPEGSRGVNFKALFSGNNASYNNGGYNGGNIPGGQNGAPYNSAPSNTGSYPARSSAPSNTGSYPARSSAPSNTGSYPARSSAPSNTGSYGAYNGWVCPNCKTRNPGNAASCGRCGANRQG